MNNCFNIELDEHDDHEIPQEKKELNENLIHKAQEKLRKFYQKQSYIKNNRCEDILNSLEKSSTKVNCYLKNNPSRLTQSLLKSIEKD